MQNLEQLTQRLLAGDRLALAKSISLVENDRSSAELLDTLYSKLGRGYRIGVTGPPGAGKSTLVDQIAKHYRTTGKSVGIIAVDPTSPFTGGALLGDRVRMNDLVLDDGVFIRSMATRGSMGGLSTKATDVADVMDAAGKEIIILETVGVGQSELDIVQTADTTLVVLVPESGDSVQAMKAGLMEIADLFVLNKADREGAEKARLEIETVLRLKQKRDWEPEVLNAIANRGEGILPIVEMIDKHRHHLSSKSLLEAKRRERASRKIASLVRERLEDSFWDETNRQLLREKLDNPEHSNASPYRVAEELLKHFKRKMEH